MKAPISKEVAEARVVQKYNKLYKPLVELVDTLQILEPGGTLVDDVSFMQNDDGTVRIAYIAKPMMLTITDGDRVFILRMVEARDRNV